MLGEIFSDRQMRFRLHRHLRRLLQLVQILDTLFRRSGTAERNIDCHSTRSCSGLTGASGNWRRQQRDYPIKSGNDQKRRMSGITAGRGKCQVMTIRKGKLSNCHSTQSCSGLTGASGKLAATAVRGLPDQVG